MGMILLIINIPFGCIALAVCACFAAANKQPRWLLAGIACYILSWFMLGLGFCLTGHEGYRYIRGLKTRKMQVFAGRGPAPKMPQ